MKQEIQVESNIKSPLDNSINSDRETNKKPLLSKNCQYHLFMLLLFSEVKWISNLNLRF
jgi:hypothetical protein